jgi:hypothetical protein
MSSDLFTRNVSVVIIGAVGDLVVDALSMTLDLFAIGLEDGDSLSSILREDRLWRCGELLVNIWISRRNVKRNV